MYDIIVVGQGPAGISAAIYAVRSGLDVLVLGRDQGSLARAEKIENYYGFVQPVSGQELLQLGLDQARRLGVDIRQEEVTGVRWEDNFLVDTDRGEYRSYSVILATGLPRKKAMVAGLTEYEGRGVSYCATCDGFFYRGKTVAVIGNGDYAFREAHELKPFAKTIYLLTHGRPCEATRQDPDLIIRTGKIAHITGTDEQVSGLVLEDGESLPVDGIFIAEGTASALDLALKLGLDHDGKVILVNKNQETNLPGLYAAGDCTGGYLQVAVAVGEGATAGMTAAVFVRQLKGEKGQTVQWSSSAQSS